MSTKSVSLDPSQIRNLTKDERKEVLKVYKRCLKPAAKFLILDLFCMLIDVLCELSVPFVSRSLFENLEIIGNKNLPITQIDQAMNQIYIAIGIMAALSIGGLIFGICCMFLATKASNTFTLHLRNELFKKIQQFSFKNLDRFEVSSLVTRITSDCNNLRMCIFMTGRMGLKTPLMIITGSIFMYIMNYVLASIILVISIILSIIIFTIIKRSVPVFTLTQQKLDNLNREIEEDCNGIKEIKAFVQEDYVSSKFNKTNTDYKDSVTKVFSLINSNMPIVLFCLNIANAIILYYGGFNSVQGTLFGMEFGVENISAFSSYSVIILMAFNFLSVLVIQFVRAGASKRRLDEVFVEKIDISYEKKEKNGDFDPNYISSGEVEFCDVGLSYSNNKDKLAVGPVNLKVKQGEIIGIVGGTGSGKTSLVSLISRLYDATVGSVKIADHDVKDYSLTALREHIGVVTQKNVLFTGTIKDNIKWGKKDATDEEVKEALDLSCSSEFVNNFLDKENTVVSQGGKSVSGGQKQRLTIARALIKKPKILILDDATSAVDTITESKIKKCFYNELKDTTVFIIAQRISSVQDADKILVLDNGNVVGLDKHDKLLKTCSVYKEIYDLQKSGVSE